MSPPPPHHLPQYAPANVLEWNEHHAVLVPTVGRTWKGHYFVSHPPPWVRYLLSPPPQGTSAKINNQLLLVRSARVHVHLQRTFEYDVSNSLIFSRNCSGVIVEASPSNTEKVAEFSIIADEKNSVITIIIEL